VEFFPDAAEPTPLKAIGNPTQPAALAPQESKEMPNRQRKIDRLSQEQTNEFLRRSSITYLECCVSLMLTHLSREEVAAILEQEANMVRELG
jgi:hypothetical protein